MVGSDLMRGVPKNAEVFALMDDVQRRLTPLLVRVRPNLVLIGAMSICFRGAIETAKYIREFLGDDVCIVLGGRHATETIYRDDENRVRHHLASPLRLIADGKVSSCFDIVLSGDGEHFIAEIGCVVASLEARGFSPRQAKFSLGHLTTTPGHWIAGTIMAALVANLELLARRDFRALKRRCRVDEDDLLDMLNEIRALDPKPGNQFQSARSESIIPDVFVLPSPGGGWHVELNREILPKVLINQTYFAQVTRLTAQSSKDQSFLNECFQSASWLVRSLDQRATTILKVATEIVRHQDVFLEDGIAHLRPLNLKTIADAIDMAFAF